MSKNDTVERLAGGIAHDFDLLLTAIVGHAESLSDYLSPGDPRAQQVAAIRQAAEQASNLTQQLLAFSRTQTLRPTILDLNAVIERARHGLGACSAIGSRWTPGRPIACGPCGRTRSSSSRSCTTS